MVQFSNRKKSQLREICVVAPGSDGWVSSFCTLCSATLASSVPTPRVHMNMTGVSLKWSYLWLLVHLPCKCMLCGGKGKRRKFQVLFSNMKLANGPLTVTSLWQHKRKFFAENVGCKDQRIASFHYQNCFSLTYMDKAILLCKSLNVLLGEKQKSRHKN